MTVHRSRWTAKAPFARDERGSTAVEFTLILIPLVMLTLGTINLGLMMYTASTLHFAVEDAARCASVKTDCSTAGATQTYAAAQYLGPTDAPTFTASVDASCGNKVVGTVTYKFTTGLTTMDVPMSATACYPLK